MTYVPNEAASVCMESPDMETTDTFSVRKGQMKYHPLSTLVIPQNSFSCTVALF